MPRNDSPCVFGDFWLDKRRDGRAPDTWQITTYDVRRKQVVYRSTHSRSLEDAKGLLRAHEEASRATGKQSSAALVVPNLMVYWNEHGRKAINPNVIAGSLRTFIAFLDQDEVTAGAAIEDLNKALFVRFVDWRMSPHSFEMPWGGKVYRVDSKGVKGESVQRNLDDIRAALNHQADNNRIPYAPKVPAVKRELRSPPRERVLSIAELGRIVGIAAYDMAMFRRVCLVLSTLVRPEAALKMDPARQYMPDMRLIDLHPVSAPRTKKHNPVVPVIEEMHPILAAWARDGATPIDHSRTAWRTMRRLAGLSDDVHLKTIRHSVATMMRGMGVPRDDIESILGHAIFRGSSGVYAKYDPTYLASAKAALSTIFQRVMAEAWSWSIGHILSKVGNEPVKVLARNDPNAKLYGPR